MAQAHYGSKTRTMLKNPHHTRVEAHKTRKRRAQQGGEVREGKGARGGSKARRQTLVSQSRHTPGSAKVLLYF